MSDVVIAVRLTADGKGLVGEVRSGAEELKKLRGAAGEVTESFDKVTQAQDKLVRGSGQLRESLARQASSLGANDLEAKAIYGTLTKLSPLLAAVAGGAIAMAKAHSEGTKEVHEMNNALVLSGNYAGTTRGQMLELARSLSDVGQMTVSTSKQIVTQLVSSGQIASEALARVAGLSENYAAAVGKQVKDIAPELVKLFEDPAKSAERLNSQYHLLSVAQIEHMQHLQRIGELGRAQVELADALSQRLPQHAEQLGVLERAWNSVRQAASSAWDSMLSVGRPKSLEEQIADQLKVVQGLRSQRGVDPRKSAAAGDQLSYLRETARWENLAVAGQAERAADNERSQQAQKLLQGTPAYQIQKLQDELTLLGRASGLPPDQLAQAQQERRDKIDELRYGKAKKERQSGPKDMGESLVNSLQSQLDALNGEASEFDKVVRTIVSGTKEMSLAKQAEALAIAGEIDDRKTLNEVLKSNAAAMEAETKARDALDTLVGGFSIGNAKALQDLDFETRLYEQQKTSLSGLYTTQEQYLRAQLEANVQRETEIAQRRLLNDYQARAAEINDKENIGLDERLRLTRELGAEYERQSQAVGVGIRGNLTARFGADQLERERQAATQFQDNLERGLIDSIFRGFEGGKSAVRNFFDAAKNLAKTTVLTPVIKFLVAPITGALTAAIGGLGIPGLASAGGSGGSPGGGALSGLNLGSLSNLFGSSFPGSNIGLSLAGGLQSLGVSTGSTGLVEFGNTLNTFFGEGLGASLGSVAPYAGALMQLVQGNVKGAAISGALTAVGSAFGPIGAGIGAIAGSLLGGGSNKVSAYGTGYNLWGSYSDASGLTATVQGLTNKGPDSLGDATRNNDVYKNAFVGLTDNLEKMLRPLYGAAVAAGAHTVTGSFAFSQGMGVKDPETAAQMVLGVSNSILEQLVPSLKEQAQANEDLTATLGRLSQAKQQADLQNVFNVMGGALGVEANLKDLWLSELSPLTPAQRLAQARGQYDTTLAGARGGDLQAVGSLAQISRAYLAELRSYDASSPAYTAGFNKVQSDISDFVDDTINEQAIQFAQLGLKVGDVEAAIKGMDARVVAALQNATAARDAADAAIQAAADAQIAATQQLQQTVAQQSTAIGAVLASSASSLLIDDSGRVWTVAGPSTYNSGNDG